MKVPSTYEELEQLLSNPQAQQLLQQVYTSHEIATLRALLQKESGLVNELLAEAGRLAGEHQELVLDKLLRVVLLSPGQAIDAMSQVDIFRS